MKPFREIEALQLDPVTLKLELETYGYALIRNLLPATILNNLLNSITIILRDAGWLTCPVAPTRRANSYSACDTSAQEYKAVYDRIFALPALHALPHHPSLLCIMKALAGNHLLLHPKPEIRLIFPDFAPGVIHAHQDHTAIRGDTETFTAWLPLHDCPTDQGPLQVLEGSHLFDLQPFDPQTGYATDHLLRGGPWAGGEINAGDLLLFHSLTVHRAAPNLSQLLRISMDFRFQSYLRPVNPSSLVFAGSGRRTWDKVYADWPSDDLKFYWTKLPVQLSPSLPELVDLVQHSPSPQQRDRYARILHQLTAETLFQESVQPLSSDESCTG